MSNSVIKRRNSFITGAVVRDIELKYGIYVPDENSARD